MERARVIAGLLMVMVAGATPAEAAPVSDLRPLTRPLDHAIAPLATNVGELPVDMEVESGRRTGQPVTVRLGGDTSRPVLTGIDWGDGTTEQFPGAPVAEGWHPGWSQVSVQHVYAQSGHYLVQGAVLDEEARRLGRVERSVEIQPELQPSLELPQQATVGETVHLQVLAPGAVGLVQVTVDWGDGTPAPQGPPRPLPVKIDHVYAEPGDFPVHVSLFEGERKATQDVDGMISILAGAGAPSAERPPERKSPLVPIVIVGAVVLVGAAVGATVLVRRGRAKPSPEPKPEPPPEPKPETPPRPKPSFRPVPDRAGVQRFADDRSPGLARPTISLRPKRGPMTIEVEES